MEITITVNGQQVTKEQLFKILESRGQNPCDIFKSYRDVCLAEGIDPVLSLPYQHPKTKKEVSLNGAFKCQTIFEAFNKRTGENYNELWEADFTDEDQEKWYPWMVYNASRGGFVYSNTYYTFTSTRLGARLYTIDSNTAAYIGTQFEAELNEFLNPQI